MSTPARHAVLARHAVPARRASRPIGVTASGPAAAAGRPARAAIVVPGGNYTADGPLLNYAAQAARRRGAHVHRIAPHVLEIDGADHNLLVPGFLGQDAWPCR